jgi:hypothetical protein
MNILRNKLSKEFNLNQSKIDTPKIKSNNLY